MLDSEGGGVTICGRNVNNLRYANDPLYWQKIAEGRHCNY